MKKTHCPLCGEKAYSHKTKLMRLQYKGNNIEVQQPGYWCDSCGDGIIGGTDRNVTQKELQTLRTKIDLK